MSFTFRPPGCRRNTRHESGQNQARIRQPKRAKRGCAKRATGRNQAGIMTAELCDSFANTENQAGIRRESGTFRTVPNSQNQARQVVAIAWVRHAHPHTLATTTNSRQGHMHEHGLHTFNYRSALPRSCVSCYGWPPCVECSHVCHRGFGHGQTCTALVSDAIVSDPLQQQCGNLGVKNGLGHHQDIQQ